MEKIRDKAFAVKSERSNIFWSVSPHPKFPTISLTGKDCALQCDYCKGRYLENMIPTKDPDTLYETCISLHQKGFNGILLSGGFNEEGYVPFEPFLESISSISRDTSLFIIAHSGLIPEDLALELGEAGVQGINFDLSPVITSVRSGNDLDKDFAAYQSYLNSISNQIPYLAPHILLGLSEDNFNAEKRVLNILNGLDFSVLVFLILIPPSDSNKYSTPEPSSLGEFLSEVRLSFPDTPFALGCMRPRADERIETEIKSIEAGVDRIVNPSTEAQNFAEKKELKVKGLDACCSLPEEIVRRWL